MPSTLIMLEGGHRVVLKGVSPVEVDLWIRDYDQNSAESPAPGHFLYLQQPDADPNGVVIDPKRIVALIRIPDKPEPRPRQHPLPPRTVPAMSPESESRTLPPSVYDGQ